MLSIVRRYIMNLKCIFKTDAAMEIMPIASAVMRKLGLSLASGFPVYAWGFVALAGAPVTADRQMLFS